MQACAWLCKPHSKVRSYHSAVATVLQAGEVAGIQPFPSTDRYADLSIHSGPTRPSQVASSSDLGEWSPLGQQVVEKKDGQRVWAVPSGPQTLEREGIPDCSVGLREDSFPVGGCRDRRIPFRLGHSMAVQNCQRPVGCPAETGAYKCARTLCAVLSSQALPFNSKNRHVLVQTDSTVYHVNHQGGTRSRQSLWVKQRLFTWAFPHFLSLRGVHVPGAWNTAADLLSRQRPSPPESGDSLRRW